MGIPSGCEKWGYHWDMIRDRILGLFEILVLSHFQTQVSRNSTHGYKWIQMGSNWDIPCPLKTDSYTNSKGFMTQNHHFSTSNPFILRTKKGPTYTRTSHLHSGHRWCRASCPASGWKWGRAIFRCHFHCDDVWSMRLQLYNVIYVLVLSGVFDFDGVLISC